VTRDERPAECVRELSRRGGAGGVKDGQESLAAANANPFATRIVEYVILVAAAGHLPGQLAGARALLHGPRRGRAGWRGLSKAFPIRAMSNKHNAERRHHIPKMKFRVRNWALYDAGLRRRGSGELANCTGSELRTAAISWTQDSAGKIAPSVIVTAAASPVQSVSARAPRHCPTPSAAYRAEVDLGLRSPSVGVLLSGSHAAFGAD
jgi:hypothetical protein